MLNREDVRDPQKEFVDDLIAIVPSFSGKVYGYRNHKTRRIVSSLKNEVNT
ncbi:MAG: DNA binding domain-containing protein, excisionase family [Promethearchaeota archaeon]|nr:MAG: DNA binding domain-containing protein, excisionase family [Candidatus Lokiarchaeota archaeon]